MQLNSERGAIAIYVAVSLLVLFGLTAFVFDDGVFYYSRRQAQNAADAAALAAATALAFDNYSDRSSGGPAYQAATTAVTAHQVYGALPGQQIEVASDPTTWEHSAPDSCLGSDAQGSCTQVDVFRDGSHSSTALPTYFAQLFGQSSLDIRATATAQLLSANASKCTKPWMASDKSDSTTYTMADIGTLLVLRAHTSPSHYTQADFNVSGARVNCPGGGGACYAAALEGCVGKDSDGTFTVGDPINEKTGATVGPNDAGRRIFVQDPDAFWNGNQVQNSCANTRTCECSTFNGGPGCANGLNGLISPRIVAIALFAPSDIAALGAGTSSAQIKNLAGAFILEPGTGPDPDCVADPDNICAYLAPLPDGTITGSGPSPGSSTNVVISLIR